jgi:hypothetical protein
MAPIGVIPCTWLVQAQNSPILGGFGQNTLKIALFYPILGHFRPISWYLAYIPKTTPFWLMHEKGPFLGILSINHQKRTLFHELAKKGWF